MLGKKIKTNTRCFIYAFLGSMLLGIGGLIYSFDPVNILTKQLLVFKPDTLLYDLWLDPAYVPLTKFYIFNVTNEEAFLNKKEKLKLNEVGPFTYGLHIRRENPRFNDDGTLTYTNERHFSFLRELSIGNPNDYSFRVPNFVLLVLSLLYHKESMVFNKAVETYCSLFSCNSFQNMTAQSFLWENKLPPLTWLRAVFPEASIGQDVVTMNQLTLIENYPNTFTMMVDKSKYISKSKILTDEEKNTTYHIVKYNGYSGLKYLGYNESRKSNMRCQSMEGSFDTLFLPPDLNRNRTIRCFHPAVCGMIIFKPVGLHKTKNGIEGYKYVTDEGYLNPPKENPTSDTCCLKGECQRKGLRSVSSCYFGAPLYHSQPHFYSGDPWLTHQISGMNPNKEDHDTYTFLHRELMIPTETRIRLQLNIVFGNTENIQSLKAFNNLVVPLAWMDFAIDELPFTLKVLEVIFLQMLPMIQSILIYSFLSLGMILLFLFLFLPLIPKNIFFTSHLYTRVSIDSKC